MPVSSQFSSADNTLNITIEGRFDYDCHQDFSTSYKELSQPAQKKYLIDLSRVNYMDSSALGMLLVLRERVGGDRSDITLVGANSEIKKVLDIANFEKLFTVQ